jgi:hypothetical protein
MVLGCKGKIVTTGIGKAGLVANKFAATLCSTGTPAVFLHAAEAAHGDLRCLKRKGRTLCFLYKGSNRDVETGSDKALRARARIPPRGVMECWSIGVLRLVRVAPADWRIQIRRVSRRLCWSESFFVRYCCVICNWNQRKASDCINSPP